MTLGADDILGRLSAEDSAFRSAGIDVFTEFLLGRRVAELIDVESTVDILLTALTEENVTSVVARHLSPAWDRHRERSAIRSEKLGDGLPPEVRDDLEALLAKQKPPKMEWAKGAVDAALVQKLLAPVLQRTLLSFAKRLPLVGAGASASDAREGVEASRGLGGLAGKLGKHAAKRAQKIAGSVGKSVIGGIGAEMNERLAGAARDFSKDAQRELRDALLDRLKSDEGRDIAREIRRQVIDRVFGTEVAVLMRDVEVGLPRAELEKLVGPVVAFDAKREIGRAVVDEELRAFLDVEGAKTVGALAAQLGIGEALRATVRDRLDALARELFATLAFRRWLTTLVTD